MGIIRNLKRIDLFCVPSMGLARFSNNFLSLFSFPSCSEVEEKRGKGLEYSLERVILFCVQFVLHVSNNFLTIFRLFKLLKMEERRGKGFECSLERIILFCV